jgi:hypothetical protein
MRKDTIETFLKQYEIFQENVQEIENANRFQSTQQRPTFWGQQPIERHAAKIYTRGIYKKFATELVNSTAFGVHEIVKDRFYELKRLFYYENPEYRRDLFTVCVDRDRNLFECECGKFEKDGILCCHILRLLTQFDIVQIPPEYIVPRWTNVFREEGLLKQKEECFQVNSSNTLDTALRYAMLMSTVNDVCADVSRDANKTMEFLEEVRKMHQKLMTEDNDVHRNDVQNVVLKDPPVIKKVSAKTRKANADAAAQNSQTELRIDDCVEPPTATTVDIWGKRRWYCIKTSGKQWWKSKVCKQSKITE